MLIVTLENSGGPLDTREVNTTEEAADAAIAMIQEAGELLEGDIIRVVVKG